MKEPCEAASHKPYSEITVTNVRFLEIMAFEASLRPEAERCTTVKRKFAVPFYLILLLSDAPNLNPRTN